MDGLNLLLRITLGILGFGLITGTLFSVIQTFVLPRSVPDVIYNFVFDFVRKVFRFLLKFTKTYKQKDRVLAYLAPFSLMALLPTWYILIQLGFSALYSSLYDISLWESILVSGSSLLTLGFSKFDFKGAAILEFGEATIGLILVALLMAYLPTIYSSFSKRETLVTMLEVRAGKKVSPVEMINRHHRIHGIERLSEMWKTWEVWFAEIEESHTSLPSLVYFRSPNPSRNWVNAAGAVLDGAALYLSVLDIDVDPQAALCLRSGYIALRSICDTFDLTYDPDPQSGDFIHISRQEFDLAYQALIKQGVPVKNNLEEAWVNFAGWRVNYDEPLLKLAGLVLAPSSDWCGDKMIPYW